MSGFTDGLNANVHAHTLKDAASPPRIDLARLVADGDGAIIALDREWRYTFVSPGAEPLMQRSRAELLGQRIDVVYPTLIDTPFWIAYTSAVSTQQFRSVEEYFAPMDTWFEAYCYPHPDGLLVHFHDITALKRAETTREQGVIALRESAVALARSESRLRLITDAFPALIGYIGADLRYVYCNRAYQEWMGRDPDSLVGVSVRELVGEKVFQQRLPHIEKVLTCKHVRFAGTMPHHASGTIRETDTTYVPDCDESGLVRGFFILMQDVTASKAAQREIDAKNKEIITIFERQGDAFAAFDTEWCFTYVNHEAERILGRTSDELLGNIVWELFPNIDKTIVYTEYLRAMREQVPVSFELYYGHLLGWFEVRAYPSPTGLSAYFRDISARKKAEVEREQAAQEKARLIAELQEANLRQRRFLREMLSSLTEGHLFLCDSEDDLPEPLAESRAAVVLSGSTLRLLRQQTISVAEYLSLDRARLHDFTTAVSEAAMNAVAHAGSGKGQVRYSVETGTIQVWIRDQGAGIAEDSLHRATLEKGYSSAGTLGHGFWLMLKTADRIYLLTGANGTTVVLEQDRNVPTPAWLPMLEK